FHFDLDKIKGFLALFSLVSLAILSSCLSNSILSAQVHESLKIITLKNSWVASIRSRACALVISLA
ncbi:hypothetical protein M2H36_20880, partial [Vibrio vulnificus]|nr:hypothetical protein [Vibrio vulnificus]